MKRLWRFLTLVMAVCLISACARDSASPRIFCEMDGQFVPTAFTFDDFKQTLAAEHGRVQTTEYKQLQTDSLAVYFKSLEDGALVAERAILLKTGQNMPPAVLFGLTNAAPVTFKLPS